MASLGERIKEYSTTPTGKIVVVAVPTAALVLVIAVVFLVVLKGGGSAGEQVAGQGAGTTATATPEATGSAQTPAGADSTATSDSVSEPPVNLDLEVYETRDPFRPADTTASSSVSVNPSTGLVSTSTAGTQTVSNTAALSLTLKSVSDQNGVLYANFDYGASSYMVRAGERVGQSPYQVTAVTTQGATLLFGDDNVTLDVGDQVTK